MKRSNILFICGSLNQTMMMHKISGYLEKDHNCYFSPFYTTGIYEFFEKRGFLDFTIIGSRQRQLADDYMKSVNMPIDHRGRARDYDLVLTCTDLHVQNNILDKPTILVQEGMTDPENIMFYVAKALRHVGFPRWLAKTSTTGLSDAYDKFCVASDGYKNLFIRKGVRPEKLIVTGIPNWDNVKEYENNDFPYKGYVLVASSDIRENFGFDNRKRFIKKALKIAGNRLLIFKLHPNEQLVRCTREIKSIAPNALVYSRGDAHHMVANCDVLITQYSTLAYTGLALGKEVYSYFDMNELRQLVPEQNGGVSAQKIAEVCRGYL